MTEFDYEDDWYRYWERAYDGGGDRMELAAADPLGEWVVADLPDLLDGDADLDPAVLRDHPDEVLRAARAAFGAFVEDQGLAGPTGGADDYRQLPVHLTGLGRLRSTDLSFALESPYSDPNTLTQVTNARMTEVPRNRTEAAHLTYRCPVGHETSLRQPLHREFTIDTCGEPGCSNEVVIDDARTRARTVAGFTVETASGKLNCLGTGRYAGPTEEARRLVDINQLNLTGIPRLIAEPDGRIKPVYEVLDAEPR